MKAVHRYRLKWHQSGSFYLEYRYSDEKNLLRRIKVTHENNTNWSNRSMAEHLLVNRMEAC